LFRQKGYIGKTVGISRVGPLEIIGCPTGGAPPLRLFELLIILSAQLKSLSCIRL
jgi:hypothetical protein